MDCEIHSFMGFGPWFPFLKLLRKLDGTRVVRARSHDFRYSKSAKHSPAMTTSSEIHRASVLVIRSSIAQLPPALSICTSFILANLLSHHNDATIASPRLYLRSMHLTASLNPTFHHSNPSRRAPECSINTIEGCCIFDHNSPSAICIANPSFNHHIELSH